MPREYARNDRRVRGARGRCGRARPLRDLLAVSRLDAPWVTVAINVVGSFLLGMLLVVHWGTPETRTVLGVGFLGGFTTFSTFSAQAWLDIDAGKTGTATLYVAASVVLGIAAAAAGYA